MCKIVIHCLGVICIIFKLMYVVYNREIIGSLISLDIYNKQITRVL